ncbi:hypothetical protein [Novosphingobium sp. Gsoil 351]|uniref:hypothetical protein n=1 Tax=Novosphingobium sp. Gsoil 351 TaxID=2675225 RepID=UPI0012B50125|nr:hypothetical protein [Novosphingobium sp. Gsoil 351]QGN55234.1 hypothetical protein GKE62_12450 [Novosphingobium sp. Gsoil 351]
MLGVRTSQVFTSRWKALIWSAGVLATAYCTIPDADDTTAAKPAKADRPSAEEVHARQIIKNLEGIKSR